MRYSDIPAVVRILRREFSAHDSPIKELVEAQTHDPFCVLVGTILSARTKDACTAGAVRRLFARAAAMEPAVRPGEPPLTPAKLARIPAAELEKLIYPVGFFREKAKHLAALPRALEERFGGVLPDTVEALCELPGVGRKTANLTVAVGFGKPAICVDVHVHRISNRWRLVDTETPFETEMALRERLPRRYWKTWNSNIVSFGQTRCFPRKPNCVGCPLSRYCDAPDRTIPRSGRECCGSPAKGNATNHKLR